MNGFVDTDHQPSETDPAVLRERLKQLLMGVGFGGSTSLAGLLRALVAGAGAAGSTSGLGSAGSGVATFPPTIPGTTVPIGGTEA